MTYEQLVKKVEELERQLKEKPSKEEVYRDLRKELLNYEDIVRAEKPMVFKTGIIIKSPNGTSWTLEIDNNGDIQIK